MSPEQYRVVVDSLLKKHYGINIEDTPLCEQAYAMRAISENEEPYESVNEWVAKSDLDRIDFKFGNLTMFDQKKVTPVSVESICREAFGEGGGVYVDYRSLSAEQFKELIELTIEKLGIEPRFSLQANLDVLQEDMEKQWPESHLLRIGVRRDHNGLKFAVRSEEGGGGIVTTFDGYKKWAEEILDWVASGEIHESINKETFRQWLTSHFSGRGRGVQSQKAQNRRTGPTM